MRHIILNLASVQPSPTKVQDLGINEIFALILLAYISLWIFYDMCITIQWGKKARVAWDSFTWYFKSWPSEDEIKLDIPERVQNGKPFFPYVNLKLPPWKDNLIKVLAFIQIITHFAWSYHDSEQHFLWALAWTYAITSSWTHSPFKCRYALLFLSLIDFVTVTMLNFAPYLVPIEYELAYQGKEQELLRMSVLFLVQGTIPFTLICVLLSTPVSDKAISYGVASTNDAPTSSKYPPEEIKTMYQYLTLSWITPLISHANNNRDISNNDIWKISPLMSQWTLYRQFIKHKGSSILIKVAKFQRSILLKWILLKILAVLINAGLTYYRIKLWDYMRLGTKEAKSEAYKLALIIFIGNLLNSNIQILVSYYTKQCQMNVEGVIKTLIYTKLLRKVNTTNDTHEKISELWMSGFLIHEKFEDSIDLYIISPIQFVMQIIVLYQIVGWSCLFGLLTIFILYHSANSSKRRRKNSDHYSTFHVHEFIDNIKLIKAYVWENKWARRIKSAQEKSIKFVASKDDSGFWVFLVHRQASEISCIPILLYYAMMTKHELSWSVVFNCLGVLREASRFIKKLESDVRSHNKTMEKGSSIEEIIEELEIFLNEPERVSLADRLDILPSTSVGFESGLFSWPKNDNSFRLQVPNFYFKQGSLNIITGSPGSGKTALLMALLGEMESLGAKVIRPIVPGSFAYATQTPFLEQSTILENILFTSPYDESRLEQVLHACSLGPDLKTFSDGLNTQVLRNGNPLSGGQKARLSLARAMYSDALVVLLDDPLSSVDNKTAHHIVENCFTGPLAQGRTIIVATNHFRHLVTSKASKEIYLDKNGSVSTKNLLCSSKDPSTSVPSHLLSLDLYKPSPTATIISNNNQSSPLFNQVQQHIKQQWSLYWMYFKTSSWLAFSLSLANVFFNDMLHQAESYFVDRVGNSSFNPTNWEPTNTNIAFWLMAHCINSLVLYASNCISTKVKNWNYEQVAHNLLYQSLDALRGSSLLAVDKMIETDFWFFHRAFSSLDVIPNPFADALDTLISNFTMVGLQLWYSPALIPVLCLGCALSYFLRHPSSMCLKKLPGPRVIMLLTRSFGRLLDDPVSLRAFQCEDKLLKEFREDRDRKCAQYYYRDCVSEYDHLIYEWYSCFHELFTIFISLAFDFHAGTTIHTLYLSRRAFGSFSAFINSFFDTNHRLSTIINTQQMLSLEREASVTVHNGIRQDWPTGEGSLVVKDLVVGYGPMFKPVLNGISFDIKAKEKFGIVGRTGSGKSTIALSLLRMIESTSGSISLEGINCKEVGLSELRERISFVSQEKMVVSGTIQYNLDPENEYPRTEIEKVLHKVGLRTEDLDLEIEENGKNINNEKGQLIGLARALLKDAKVIILDEIASDSKIHEMLHDTLKNNMVICIAHRIHNIINYDRIMVLDEGKVVEMDTPANLLAKEDGHFRLMCEYSDDPEFLWDRAHNIST